ATFPMGRVDAERPVDGAVTSDTAIEEPAADERRAGAPDRASRDPEEHERTARDRAGPAFGRADVDGRSGHGLPRSKRHTGQSKRARSKRPSEARSGAHRSPRRLMRAGTLSSRKSSIATPRSISCHVTGVDTAARGLGRTEYTDASVRPHAFWL